MTGKRIFNHDIMHCTHDAVVGNYLYSGRVLGMSESEDLIQLHPDLKSQWKAITTHHDNIGLSHSQNPLWDVSFKELRQHPNYEPSVFIFSDILEELEQDEDWLGDHHKNWQNVVEFNPVALYLSGGVVDRTKHFCRGVVKQIGKPQKVS